MQGYPIKLQQGSRKRAIDWLASARVLNFCVLGWSFARKGFSTMIDSRRRTKLVCISCPLVDRRIFSLQTLLIQTMSLNKWLLQASGAPPIHKTSYFESRPSERNLAGLGKHKLMLWRNDQSFPCDSQNQEVFILAFAQSSLVAKILQDCRNRRLTGGNHF